MTTDPVCKMVIDETQVTLSSDVQGRRFYFCSPGCKEAFDEDPEQFLVDTDILGRKRKPT